MQITEREPAAIQRVGPFRGWRWCLVLVLAVCCWRPLTAHTFTAITADLLQDGDELALTLGLQLLDVIAIIDGAPTSAGSTLSHSQLIEGMPDIRDYLARHVRVRVLKDGIEVPGRCLGYIPDLTDPPAVGEPLAELLPDRLPFLLVWTLPAGTTRIEVVFDLLIDVVGSGVVHANLHQGDSTRSRFVDLGRSATFDLLVPATSTPPPADSTVVPGPATRPPAPPAPPPPASSGDDEEAVDAGSLGAGGLLLLGFRHIVPEGLDHILFVVCLFLLSPALKPLLIQVTAFTLAHSVTLGLAMAGWVLLPSRLVETLIAASIVVMAVENIFMRTVKPWRWSLVFLFGLIHGLGFAGSFSALQLSPGDFARPLLLLNLGIELGQLAVVAACALLTCWAWKRPWYTRGVIIPASAAIAMLAGWWTIERGFAL
jgi:hypothetical protein